MSNFAKSQAHYIRTVYRRGHTTGISLPANITRSTNFGGTAYVIITAINADELRIVTWESYRHPRWTSPEKRDFPDPNLEPACQLRGDDLVPRPLQPNHLGQNHQPRDADGP